MINLLKHLKDLKKKIVLCSYIFSITPMAVFLVIEYVFHFKTRFPPSSVILLIPLHEVSRNGAQRKSRGTFTKPVQSHQVSGSVSFGKLLLFPPHFKAQFCQLSKDYNKNQVVSFGVSDTVFQTSAVQSSGQALNTYSLNKC